MKNQIAVVSHAQPENEILQLPDLGIPSVMDEFFKKAEELEKMKEKVITELQARREKAWNVVLELDKRISDLTGKTSTTKKSMTESEILVGAEKLLGTNKEGMPASAIAAALGGDEAKIRAVLKTAQTLKQEGNGRASRYLLK